MLVKLKGWAKVKYTIEVAADSVQDAIDQVDVHLQVEPRYTLDDMTILDAEMASEPEAEITEEDFKVRVKGIDYAVGWEDVDDGEDHSEEWYNKRIKAVKDKLPTTLDLDICCAEDDIDEVLSDAISEDTGWLINGYESFEILERK